MRSLRSLSVLIVCSLQLFCAAQEPERERNWHLRGQFAGYQGMFSIGGGPVLAKGWWRPGLMYGFAPLTVDRKAVHQVIIRNDLVLFPDGEQKYHVSPTASLNLLIETGTHSFLKLPERFPAGYYLAPQLHGTFGIGALLNKTIEEGKFFKQIGFAAEFVGLDTYMWYAISQPGVPIHQAFGLSFALAASF